MNLSHKGVMKVAVYFRAGVDNHAELLELLNKHQRSIEFFDAGNHSSTWEGQHGPFGPDELRVHFPEPPVPSDFVILVDTVELASPVINKGREPFGIISRYATVLRSIELETLPILAYFSVLALVQFLVNGESNIVRDSPSVELGPTGWRDSIEGARLPKHESELANQFAQKGTPESSLIEACEEIRRSISIRCLQQAEDREREVVKKGHLEIAHSELHHQISKIVKHDIESLIRTEELGRKFSFEAYRRHFENIQRVVDDLKQSTMAMLPTKTAWKLERFLRDVEMLFLDIENFNPVTASDARGDHERLQEGIQEALRDCFDKIVPLLSYLKPESSEAAAKLSTFLESADEVRNQVDFTLDRVKSIEDESIAIRDSLKKVVGEAAFRKEAEYFQAAADRHSVAAAKWFKGVLWAAGALLLFAAANLWYHMACYRPDKWEQMVPATIAKMIVLSILSYLVAATIRIYKAHRHNCVLNEHRANALSTFEAFAHHAKDDATKNAILTTATESIFSVRQTGYQPDEPTQQSSPQILEVIRSLPGKSGE